MKKNLVKLGMSLMLCSSLHAFDYNVVNGEHHLGAVINIDDMSIFDKSAVDYVYRQDFSQLPNEVYEYYEVNKVFPKKANGSALSSLNKGEGFFLKANGSVVISDTPSAIEGKYYEVTSPTTQRVWLDRNLGATEVCTKTRSDFASYDYDGYKASQAACFGDYFQWGRGSDGHESKESGTRTNLTSSWATLSSSLFILADQSRHAYDWATNDDNGNGRSASWAKTDGTSICPDGFRVPTISELTAEAANMSNLINVLKFPLSGKRDRATGKIYSAGYNGYNWSTTPDDLHSNVRTNRLVFSETGFNGAEDDRGYGYSVRCIKH